MKNFILPLGSALLLAAASASATDAPLPQPFESTSPTAIGSLPAPALDERGELSSNPFDTRSGATIDTACAMSGSTFCQFINFWRSRS